jgi:hypothetical protein
MEFLGLILIIHRSIHEILSFGSQCFGSTFMAFDSDKSGLVLFISCHCRLSDCMIRRFSSRVLSMIFAEANDIHCSPRMYRYKLLKEMEIGATFLLSRKFRLIRAPTPNSQWQQGDNEIPSQRMIMDFARRSRLQGMNIEKISIGKPTMKTIPMRDFGFFFMKSEISLNLGITCR